MGGRNWYVQPIDSDEIIECMSAGTLSSMYSDSSLLAEAMGFDRFPKVRWDEGVLKDTILYMNTLSSLVDRRMLSYRTSLEALGFDYKNELKNMEAEMPMVEDGIFGIIGSPWQQSKTQPVQGAPIGSPSNGRPKGQTKKKDTNTNPAKQPGTKPNKPSKKTASVDIEMIKSMTSEQLKSFYQGAKEILDDDKFLDTVYNSF